ncbi:FliH/SctL family protein [Carboxydothermus pertinax]|uniref:Flagellar protein n=1 Tax=Carboxydothermus pertinax TaxID=870242 RepID=A0A1L8CUI3_9THEO|nr:FliH/SctL family protein [Carboxydothermus pertinax]GAV22562.1 flagellar protein [Carboxydothermus pertinax]
MPWLFKSSLIAKEITQQEAKAAKVPVRKIQLTFGRESVEEHSETNEMLGKAKEEARRIIDRAQQEGEAIKEKARLEGFNQGYADGQQKAQKEYEKLATKLQAVFKKLTKQRILEIQQERQKILAELEPQIFNFVETALQKLLGELPEATTLFYRKWLGEALNRFKEKKLATIFVNPEEYGMIKNILEQNGAFNEIILLTEPEIAVGTVLLKGEENYVVSLKVFTEEILQKLRDGV